MSQQNAEIVKQVYAALTRGDEDTLRDLAVPEFVLDFSRRLVDPVVVRGLEDALAFFFGEAREVWDDWPAWEPQKVIGSDDKVVAYLRTYARGKGSGVEVEAYVWNLWTFRGEKLVEVAYFGDDQAAALEAAGVSERQV